MKPIAALMNRLDEARHVGLVAERDAQPPHGRVQAVLEIDECPLRPEALAQLLAADDLARPLEQGSQNAERLLLERDAEAALAELSRSEIDLEGAEPDDVRRGRRDCLHTLTIESIVA